MMIGSRDRASGWKHAKLSGHKNEELVCNLLKTDATTQARLKKVAQVPAEVQLVSCDYGGLCETDVASVLGGKTKNKIDLTAEFTGGKRLGISVKKSLGGQVYLIKDESFRRGMEKQYKITIPAEIQRAIQLFWGSAADVEAIIEQFSHEPAVKIYELRKHRLTAQTLKNYDPALYEGLLEWFKENIYNITDFCFSRGLALSPDERATVIWYKNMLGEHTEDAMYDIADLCAKVAAHKAEIAYGTRGGGTVINLPFGFVQWHQDSMQFHHQYKCIAKLEA